MRRRILALTIAALALPAAAHAQGIGVAARAGTLGIGAEGALGLTDNIVIRGGLSLLPLEFDASDLVEVGDDVTADLKLPESWYNIGADLYLGGSFRIGGGMLFKPDDPTLTATLTATGTIEIDGQTYTGSDVASVLGTFDSSDSAPYALIGFGKHTNSGFGFFLDLGAAFLGEPEVTLTASGNPTVVNSASFQQQLRNEEARIEDEAGTYLKIWPIIQVGIRIGIG